MLQRRARMGWLLSVAFGRAEHTPGRTTAAFGGKSLHAAVPEVIAVETHVTAARPLPSAGARLTALEVPLPGHWNWWRSLAAPCAGWVIGHVSYVLRPHMELKGGAHLDALLALLCLCALALSLAVAQGVGGKRVRSLLGYQAEVLALWAGYVGGWSLAHGAVWDDLLGVALLSWLGCAAVGGLLPWLRRQRSRELN